MEWDQYFLCRVTEREKKPKARPQRLFPAGRERDVASLSSSPLLLFSPSKRTLEMTDHCFGPYCPTSSRSLASSCEYLRREGERRNLDLLVEQRDFRVEVFVVGRTRKCSLQSPLSHLWRPRLAQVGLVHLKSRVLSGVAEEKFERKSGCAGAEAVSVSLLASFSLSQSAFFFFF